MRLDGPLQGVYSGCALLRPHGSSLVQTDKMQRNLGLAMLQELPEYAIVDSLLKFLSRFVWI